MPSTKRSSSLAASTKPPWTLDPSKANQTSGSPTKTPDVIIWPKWNAFHIRSKKSRVSRLQIVQTVCRELPDPTHLDVLLDSVKEGMRLWLDDGTPTGEKRERDSKAEWEEIETRVRQCENGTELKIMLCRDMITYGGALSEHVSTPNEFQRNWIERYRQSTQAQSRSPTISGRRRPGEDPGIEQLFEALSTSDRPAILSGEKDYYSDPGVLSEVESADSQSEDDGESTGGQ